jgi:hypothetical protein
MSALISSLNDGSQVIPGEYSRGMGQYSIRTPAPSIATASSLVPGLFVGRQGANFTQVSSFDQLTTPVIANVVGVVARQKVAIGGLVSYAQIAANYLDTGISIDVLQSVSGYVWVWVGNAVVDSTSVWISTVFAGSGPTLIVPGMLVNASTTGALNISDIASYSSYNGSTFSLAQGNLAAICLADLNR